MASWCEPKYMMQSKTATRNITATQFHENTGKTIMLEVPSASCYEPKFMMQSEAATSKITATQFHENTVNDHAGCLRSQVVCAT